MDRDGLKFRASAAAGEARDTTLTWPQIARVDALPVGAPTVAWVRATTTDGRIVTWRVGRYPELMTILDQLRQDLAVTDL